MLATVVAVIIFCAVCLSAAGCRHDASPGGWRPRPRPSAPAPGPADLRSPRTRRPSGARARFPELLRPLSSIDPAPEPLAAAGSWTVQVTALPSGDDAQTLADGLKARGYPAS